MEEKKKKLNSLEIQECKLNHSKNITLDPIHIRKINLKNIKYYWICGTIGTYIIRECILAQSLWEKLTLHSKVEAIHPGYGSWSRRFQSVSWLVASVTPGTY